MLKPAYIFIGLRYFYAKRPHQFISFISLISLLGIALGVIVLITVLSVLNGFDKEIKKQVFGMIPPIIISDYSGQMTNWEDVYESLKMNEQITGIAPFIMGQSLLTANGISHPALIHGIIPKLEISVSTLNQKIVKGHFDLLQPGRFNIILGETLANKLNVKLNDMITVAIPPSSFSASHITPRFKQFNVVGIFKASGGNLGFDSNLVFIHLKDAQILFKMGSKINALQINIKDAYDAPIISHELQNQLPFNFHATNWTRQLGDFFENIRMTKTIMFFIFILIITVAIFNLIATMVMVVKNKQSDIAILRTLGATPQTILSIFIIQGLTIGLGGTILGILGGILLSLNITSISTWLQSVLHMQLISREVYFVNYLPAELHWPDVWVIGVIAIFLCLFGTLYPAWNASRILPAEALRYD